MVIIGCTGQPAEWCNCVLCCLKFYIFCQYTCDLKISKLALGCVVHQCRPFPKPENLQIYHVILFLKKNKFLIYD